jgi:ribonuclease HI
MSNLHAAFRSDFLQTTDEDHYTGVYFPESDVQICRRLTDELSVYSVEMLAIIVALQWLEDVQPVRIIVGSDSLSVLNSLSSGKSNRSDLLLEVFMLLWRIERMGVVVRFCWVPAHSGFGRVLNCRPVI